MRLTCQECRKRYEYSTDEFCPRCGAYNRPPRADSNQPVLRRDGVNEANHRGSFVHHEVHSEKRQRRGQRLDRPKPPVLGAGKRGSLAADTILDVAGDLLDFVVDVIDP